MFLSFFWIRIGKNDDFHGTFFMIWGIISIIITITSWIVFVRQAKRQGRMAEVYQHRVLYLKSLLPILGWGLVILILFQITITSPYFNKCLKAYETTVIDRIIEDEVGMTKWKALRDLAQKEIGNK
jgi:hypothetical protein